MNGQPQTTNPSPTFQQEPVASTLSRLHALARNDWKSMVAITPDFIRNLLTGKNVWDLMTPSRFKDAYMPVAREAGAFLYMTARVLNAQKIVEYGSSFGISTLYLAAAVKDNGGGSVITTEIEPNKCRATEQNLREAGLDAYVQVLEGDASKTLKDVEGPIDLLFLDGWKNLYLPLLEMLQPKLRKRAVILADNIRFTDARPYADRVRSPQSGFISTTLFNGNLEYSCLMS
jgi:predicted O-methyltransferase YrrM